MKQKLRIRLLSDLATSLSRDAEQWSELVDVVDVHHVEYALRVAEDLIEQMETFWSSMNASLSELKPPLGMDTLGMMFDELLNKVDAFYQAALEYGLRKGTYDEPIRRDWLRLRQLYTKHNQRWPRTDYFKLESNAQEHPGEARSVEDFFNSQVPRHEPS